MMAPQPRKKGARSEGDPGPRCYCNKTKAECACQVFQPRPCTRCKHGYHDGACECGCTNYKADGTPEFFLREGIRAGEWGFELFDRYRALMRPEHDPIIRVCACVMLHVADRRGRGQSRARLAMYINEDGNLVPLSPAEIMRQLNALDTIPRLDRHAVRKALREIERLGMIRVVGAKRDKVRIFLYAKPLKSRDLEPLPEPRLRLEATATDEPDPDSEGVTQFPGGLSRPPEGLNSRDPNYLRGRILLPVRCLLVKTFRQALRDELQSRNLEGVQPDPLEIVERVVDEVLQGVQLAYQKALQGVCGQENSPENPNKNEVFDSSTFLVVNNEEGGRALDTCNREVPPQQETPPARPPADPLAFYLAYRHLLPDGELLEGIRYVLQGVPLEYFFDVLDDRLKRGRIGTGLLMQMAKKAASQWAVVKPSDPQPYVESDKQREDNIALAWRTYREDPDEYMRQIARDLLVAYGAWAEPTGGEL